jgi:superfamily II DNA or RNA helicase
MSIILNVNSIANNLIDKINEDLVLKIDNKVGGITRTLYIYEILNDYIFLPLWYSANELKIPRRNRKEFSVMSINFEATLRDEQKIIKDEAISSLNKSGCVLISCYTGFGKSILAINLAYTIKLKTLVIVNKLVLIKQWEESILNFCPNAKVQKVTAKTKYNGDADFFIINAMNVEKMGKKYFNDIGLCIVDEAHLIMAETLSKSLKYISPRYLIGLTATPYRPDGFDRLLELYFGKNKIIREMNREHLVYHVKTGFKPKMVKTENGKVNWGLILQEQSENENRNKLIINISQHFKDRNILILTKRVEQGKLIFNILKELGENVSSLIGTQQEFDKDCRILVGTTSKCGTGFDFAKLDALILACDVDQYFIQVLGRIFRRKDTIPLVFDLVDDNPILIKHYKNREEVYCKIGGKIIDFNRKFSKLLDF